MSASETGISPFRDIGTRRRCPTHSGERPKRRGHARHAHRSTLWMVVAGYHPPTRTYVSHQRATLKPRGVAGDVPQGGGEVADMRGSRNDAT